MFRAIAKFIFKITGWKVEGSFPPELKKYIIAVAPHTSNWDFPVGVLARSVLHLENGKYLGKDSLFKPPFGWFFRWLGGYPVDRSSSHDVVQQVVNIFNQHDEFILAMAPEGTRKKVEKLRTGFYYIAKGAQVPIIPCGFDFEKKIICVGAPFYPTDDQESDLQFLISYYRTIKGKNPELAI
ncbi:MAG: lysophospholipid acyltransferase family protein [Cyclobacteriaceae bacterium]|nr:lysophospholipid acyltransferase family protein [Cyclobacteriaceae bacterium]